MNQDDDCDLPVLLPVETDSEVRVLTCLDRSSSMRTYHKYALIARQYPVSLRQLAATAPAAMVETWWFARSLTRFAALAPVNEARSPDTNEYRAAIEGGSVIADSLVHGLERAESLKRKRGAAPTKLVVWTDGWNRRSQYSPREVREHLERSAWVETYLIGFVDHYTRKKLDEFVAAAGLRPDQVHIFAHDDDAASAWRAAQSSSNAFSSSIRHWRRTGNR